MRYSSTFLIYLAIGISVVFLVSRLLLFLSRRWDGGYGHILAANAASAALCIGVFTLSKAHPIAWQNALIIFAPAQIIILLVDLVRHFRAGRARGA